MSRTYIGPFGRVLPILDGNEPEQQQFPVDETRTNMTTYQLPPPERLQFGSDTAPGFTEPVRYNTISQSRRAPETTSSPYSEQPRPSPHEHLPPVRQLFFPLPPNIQTSQYLPRHDANASQRLSNLPPAPRSVPDQSAPVPQYSYQGSFRPAPLSPHIPPSTSANSRREELGNSPSGQQPPPSQYDLHHGPSAISYPPPYPIYHERPPQALYSAKPNPQHAPPPNSPRSHQSPPTNAHQPQQMIPLNVPVPYYEEHSGDYDLSSAPSLGHQQSPQPAENSVKPMARVVGDADVPGQGPSWVYEDGTTCKKVIDGEEVNAQWGVTKAGKPRKRLAIACTTCREKKIKCDPAEPKCVQCEKFGRECKFTTAFRNQRTSPETPSYRSQARTSPINIMIEPPSWPSLPSDPISVSMQDEAFLKRRKSSPQSSRMQTSEITDTKCHVYKSPLKKHRSSPSVPLSPKEERKVFPLQSDAHGAGPRITEKIHKGIESKVAIDSVAPLLSAKAEMKVVDELKARRETLLRAIEQKCEDECREEMKPCSIMLRLEIMDQGYAKSWVK